MFLWALSFLLLINVSLAEVGKVSKVLGSGDAYVMRGSDKIILASDFELQEGDEVYTQDSVIQIFLYPTTQINLSKQTQIKITKNIVEENETKDKSFSIISFVKGLVRLQVTKDDELEIDQKVEADGVSFAVRGTEFEVSKESEDFDLDVIEGEVEVSSPLIQTFVPELVKANEGFRFNKKARKFERRKFRQKFKDHPSFVDRKELRMKWKEKRKARKKAGAQKRQRKGKK